LSIGNDACHGNFQPTFHFAEQSAQVLLAAPQEGAGQQDFSRKHLPNHPEHLMSHIRLKPIHGQQDPSLGSQSLLQAPLIREMQRNQLLVAMHQMFDRALTDGQSSLLQAPLDFGSRTLFPIAQSTNQRDQIQTTFSMR